MIFLRMKKGKEEKTFPRQYYEKEQGMVKIENIKWKWNREIERLKQRKDKERLKEVSYGKKYKKIGKER